MLHGQFHRTTEAKKSAAETNDLCDNGGLLKKLVSDGRWNSKATKVSFCRSQKFSETMKREGLMNSDPLSLVHLSSNRSWKNCYEFWEGSSLGQKWDWKVVACEEFSRFFHETIYVNRVLIRYTKPRRWPGIFRTTFLLPFVDLTVYKHGLAEKDTYFFTNFLFKN